MNKLILLLIIGLAFSASALAQEKETVTINKDRDGHTVTHKDGTKHSYGKGYTTKEVKEVYTSQGVKVRKSGRNPNSTKTSGTANAIKE
ncbi:hypothetical protein WNY77_05170 [Paraglaciecola mesophila]|uniref:DUF3892 domain-containing protein n=1 Tax=Paraglaciecola mesophila TaxID=197222 RepID=A0ABU9SSA7_9ALTE|tara:strand:- start:701 stop:967 length:267 start_codon:yes stop_codon:yes gene_type:complete